MAPLLSDQDIPVMMYKEQYPRGLASHLCPLLTVSKWKSHLNSLGLSFVICEMRIIILRKLYGKE